MARWLEAGSPGQDLKISFGQVNRRRTVIGQFTPSQLEMVTKARQSGLLTRLQKEPQFLMLHVTEEADHARKRALEETKRLAEYEMLASIREPCGPCGSSSHRDRPQAGAAAERFFLERPPPLFEAEAQRRAAAAQSPSSSSN